MENYNGYGQQPNEEQQTADIISSSGGALGNIFSGIGNMIGAIKGNQNTGYAPPSMYSQYPVPQENNNNTTLYIVLAIIAVVVGVVVFRKNKS
jgi:hypothetical protein